MLGTIAFRDRNQTPKILTGEIKQRYLVIQENTLIGLSNPSAPKIRTLGMLEGVDLNEAINSLVKKYELDYECYTKILECESNFENICNQNYGCSSGIGLGQLIPKTAKHTSKMLGREIDPSNVYDNLEASAWLLANEGTEHWGCPTCNWGSWSCWYKACQTTEKL